MQPALAEALALKHSPMALAGVIGSFHISQRDKIDRELLSHRWRG